MPRWTHIIFIFIWLFMALSFGYLAVEAKKLEYTKLSIFTSKIPQNLHLNWNTDKGPVSITGVINDIAESHNQNVAILENSIHQSAKTSFMLNAFSCLFALMGLVAQVKVYTHEKYREKNDCSHPPNQENIVTCNSSKSDADFYWEWTLHEDHIFTNRGSFFLVGESMLLAAFATLYTTKANTSIESFQVFSLAGLFITVIWLYINIIHIFVTQKSIKNILNEIEPRWKSIASRRRKWIPNHILMGIILPSGLLIVWIALWIIINFMNT